MHFNNSASWLPFCFTGVWAASRADIPGCCRSHSYGSTQNSYYKSSYVPEKEGSLGSVEKGKLADLVIFSANPVQNIQNLNLIEAVIANGKLYDRASLDNELMKVEYQVKSGR